MENTLCSNENFVNKDHSSDRAVPSFLSDKNFYTDYAIEVINTYFEDQQIPLQNGIKSDQLDIRNKLVKILKSLAKYQKFQVTTTHLAVCLLDIYINEYIVSDISDHQKFVTFVILLLAAKSEDLDEKVPSTKDLLHMVDLTDEIGMDLRNEFKFEEENTKNALKYFNQLYCQLEFLIFETAQFNTIRPTAVHFLKIFETIAVTEEDLTDLAVANDNKVVIESLGDLKLYADAYFGQLLNIILEHIEFNTVLPSKVAASVIACTRQMLGIKTVWTPTLQQYLRCSYEDISPIVNAFLEYKASGDLTKLVKLDEEEDEWICDSGYVEDDMEEPDAVVEMQTNESDLSL